MCSSAPYPEAVTSVFDLCLSPSRTTGRGPKCSTALGLGARCFAVLRVGEGRHTFPDGVPPRLKRAVPPPFLIGPMVAMHTPIVKTTLSTIIRTSPMEGHGGNVCPARTGPLQGPNCLSENRGLPYLAGFLVKIAISETELRQIRQVSGLTTRV